MDTGTWRNLQECILLNDGFAAFLFELRAFLQRLCNISLVSSKPRLFMITSTHCKWPLFRTSQFHLNMETLSTEGVIPRSWVSSTGSERRVSCDLVKLSEKLHTYRIRLRSPKSRKVASLVENFSPLLGELFTW